MSILSTKTGSNEKIEKLKKELTNPTNLKPLNLFIDGDLKTRFKVASAKMGVTMTEVLIEAISKFLAENEAA